MTRTQTPLLHRDDPEKDPLVGHVKVTREDWLNQACTVLIEDGVGEVKILALSERLGVSRSSFYWYFENRKDLLEALLQDWEARNTRSIVTACKQPVDTIAEGACNFFRCFIEPGLFDTGLDFAVREWSRRDDAVRARINQADEARLAAVTGLFARLGYSEYDADIRARIIYYMQLGYHALDVREPMSARMARLEGYLRCFTGQEPDPETVRIYQEFARSLDPS